MQAKKEYAQMGNDEIWIEQQQRYRPSLEKWHCGCMSYSKSAYHICKHLIRLYIGNDGLESNKPPMPYYGEVWRQSTVPLLWVSGIHSPDQLLVRDLQANTSAPPILGDRPSNVEPDAPNRQDGEPLELPEIDPDDEYSDEEEEADENTRSVGNRRDITPVGFLDGDNDDDFTEQEELYDSEVKERHEYITDLKLLLEELEDMDNYPSTHPHSREVPRAKLENTPVLMAWAKRRRALKNERRASPTWSQKRRQNMFM